MRSGRRSAQGSVLALLESDERSRSSNKERKTVAENQRFGQGEGQGLDIPILPLRNSVFFPGSIMPISVGRPKTLAMVKAVEESGEPIGIVAQKDGSIDD